MKEHKVPMRRCIGCMESSEQRELIRITYDGERLLIDMGGRAKGRGVYLHKNEECINKVRKNRAFNRNYKTNINLEVTEAVLDEALQLVKEVSNGETEDFRNN